MNDIDSALEAIRNAENSDEKLEHIMDVVNQMNSLVFILNQHFAKCDGDWPEEIFHLGYLVDQIEYMSKNLLEILMA